VLRAIESSWFKLWVMSLETGRNSATALLVLSSVLWGSSFVSIKIGLAYLNAFEFAFLRMALSAAILFAVFAPYRKISKSLFKEPAVWSLGILNGLAFTIQFVGLVYTTAAKTALLVDLNVVFVAMLSWKFLGEKFGARKGLGVSLGVLGAVLVATNGNFTALNGSEFFGDALVFSSGLIWAFFIILHKHAFSKAERTVAGLSSAVMFVTALALLPMAIISNSLHPAAVTVQGWVIVAYTAIMCTVLPYVFWLAGLKTVTATVASVIGLLEIIFAMALSTLLLGETYTPGTLIGAGLILLSAFAVAET
jgi:drug/metabolite transporter (DMT)-like permease